MDISVPQMFIDNYSLYTECVTDLNQQSKMIIFMSILTTFEQSIIL